MLHSIFLLLLIAFISITSVASQYQSGDRNNGTTTPPPCGQYGFRCESRTTFRICDLDYEDSSPNDQTMVHECGEGTICDEDEPAYCKPDDGITFDDKMDGGKRVRNIEDVRLCGDGSNEYASSEEEQEIQTTTTENEQVVEWENEAPTVGNDHYECSTYGYFPDINNNTFYWFCDISPNPRIGYTVKHIECGPNRYFDPRLRFCVLPGTVRNIRNKPYLRRHRRRDHHQSRISSEDGQHPECENRKKFRDRKSCVDYFLCVNNGNKVVKVRCPRAYEFSDAFNQCMPQNMADCHV